MDRKVTAPASVSIPLPATASRAGAGGNRSPAPLFRLASPALECLSVPGFVSQNNWNLRNCAFKPDIKCHLFYLALRAFREEMLPSDPRYRWDGKLQGYESADKIKQRQLLLMTNLPYYSQQHCLSLCGH